MPKKKTETYSEAIDRLEKIVAQIDSNELDIDQLAARIKEANEIIAFCTGTSTNWPLASRKRTKSSPSVPPN